MKPAVSSKFAWALVAIIALFGYFVPFSVMQSQIGAQEAQAAILQAEISDNRIALNSRNKIIAQRDGLISKLKKLHGADNDTELVADFLRDFSAIANRHRVTVANAGITLTRQPAPSNGLPPKGTMPTTQPSPVASPSANTGLVPRAHNLDSIPGEQGHQSSGGPQLAPVNVQFELSGTYPDILSAIGDTSSMPELASVSNLSFDGGTTLDTSSSSAHPVLGVKVDMAVYRIVPRSDLSANGGR